MAISRFQIAKPDVVEFIDSLNKVIFTNGELKQILSDHRSEWRLTKSMTFSSFSSELLKRTAMKKVSLKFPHRTETRYFWKDCSVYELAHSIRPKGYLSHYSAMHLFGLTDQIPKTIYINSEQHPPSTRGSLSQDSINRAFQNKVRVSNAIANYGDYNLILINSMGFNGLGIVNNVFDDDLAVRVTSVERTLIDAAIRPTYCGGIHEVYKAFIKAANTVSVNKMYALLQKLNYSYPYHQSIGYYLSKTGLYSETQVSIFKDIPIIYDFYLTHKMGNTQYIKEWNLFVPKGF
jgi:AbiEi antitoxin C-terminal domain